MSAEWRDRERKRVYTNDKHIHAFRNGDTGFLLQSRFLLLFTVIYVTWLFSLICTILSLLTIGEKRRERESGKGK